MNIFSPYEVDMEELLANQESWDIFATKFINLPLNIKNVLSPSSTSDYLKYLSENLNLNNDQSAELSRIIRDVLLGDLFIGEMPQNISDRMKLPPDEAKKVGNLIVSELFGPAIEDIKKLQVEKFPEKINKPIHEKPDLKIEPGINKNNIVDLRNK